VVTESGPPRVRTSPPAKFARTSLRERFVLGPRREGEKDCKELEKIQESEKILTDFTGIRTRAHAGRYGRGQFLASLRPLLSSECRHCT